MRDMRIWFASNNAGKKRELEAILNIKLCIPSENGVAFDPEETGMTFYENAMLKARELKKLVGKDEPVIADDSGLSVDALDGRPGVFSARYGQVDGAKITSERQNKLLLDEIGDNPKRDARFICAMALMFDERRFFIVQETLEGEITRSLPRGDGGFGYDPIFLIPELGRSLAELSVEEKNRISHRGKAGRIIAGFLNCQN